MKRLGKLPCRDGCVSSPFHLANWKLRDLFKVEPKKNRKKMLRLCDEVRNRRNFLYRNETLTNIRELWKEDVLASNTALWDGRARNELIKYEKHLYEFYKRGATDRGQKVWTFWNAVFYCGTIYTTIGEFRLHF